MIDSITTFDLADVLLDEPQLQPILNTLAENVSAFHIADGTLLRSLLEEEHQQLPMIILRSQRIPDGWPLTVDECDAFLDVFQSDFMDSMSYLVWTGDGFSVGVPAEPIAEILATYPRCDQMLVAWVTETELVLDYVEMDDELYERMDAAENSWRLGRFIPDKQYAASKMAQFPPLISDREMCIISERGEPLYLMDGPGFGPR
ncbi:hypothetical protein [Duganella sp. LjRoot269]|uniref:hypothetical protein n=1 Tax=Duganella sp. LjRoot269 TaxID=3342305 RepID=UPI003ECDFA8F